MAANYTWESVCLSLANATTPLPRSSHDLTYVNGKVYIFGGENVARNPISSSVFIYDLEDGMFDEHVGDIVPLRLAHAQAAVGSNLLRLPALAADGCGWLRATAGGRICPICPMERETICS